MGNLRQSMTDEEWDNLGSKIKKDRENGKPDSNLIYLCFGGLPLNQKKAIRESLLPFYNIYELRELDRWIEWDEKQKK